MPLSLICDCGARFEVEDALAGQTVSCPECQQPLKAPAARRPTLRTSGFALASFLLAVVGAFTVVGTVAAVILGVVAFVLILRDRERVAGLGFAFAGVGLGLVFTVLTLWALSTGELFGLGSGMRRLQMADGLEPADPKAPLEVKESGFSITRPTAKWLKAKKEFQYLLVQPLLRKDPLLLLVNPDLYAFADVQVDFDPRLNTQSIQEYVLNRLKPEAAPAPADKGKANPQFNARGDEETDQLPADLPKLLSSKQLPAEDGVREAYEFSATEQVGGKGWTMLVRIYKTTGGKLYMVRAFAETAHFARVKDELTKVLDSFKLTPAP